MYCPTPNKTKKGFTLVEVLMVLVIISIMAGLLITVINPVRQRARARDGTIIASANKIVAAITAFNSATGVFPTCAELMSDLQNVTTTAAWGCTGTNLEGTFTVTGITFPATCAANGYGTGAAACGFRYDSNGTTACLGVRMHSIENLDDITPLGDYLLWTSTQGRFTDATSGGCSIT